MKYWKIENTTLEVYAETYEEAVEIANNRTEEDYVEGIVRDTSWTEEDYRGIQDYYS